METPNIDLCISRYKSGETVLGFSMADYEAEKPIKDGALAELSTLKSALERAGEENAVLRALMRDLIDARKRTGEALLNHDRHGMDCGSTDFENALRKMKAAASAPEAKEKDDG